MFSNVFKNKAVYVWVAYGWAGAVMQVKPPFSVFLHSMTNGQVGGRTDGPTDSDLWSRVYATKN